MTDPSARAELEITLGHSFVDQDLLQRALTHRSWAYEKGIPGQDGEALEFLGDAVLSLGVSRLLCERFAGMAVGGLSRARAWLVSEPSLAGKARELGLGKHVRLGRGEDQCGGREKDSILADVYESVLGAIYIDGGAGPAFALIERQFRHEVERLKAGDRSDRDFKTDLQEALQAARLPVPDYRVAAETGPGHRKSFTVELLVGGKVLSSGTGYSKKAAEQEAARDLLGRLPQVLPVILSGPR